MTMRLIAIDTALAACSVAILDGDSLTANSETIGRGHAERLMPMVADTLAGSGLEPASMERIVVTVGPGSFTGVRVGIAAARGLALALGVPVAGIGTLRALALSVAAEAGTTLAVVDARHGHVYAQTFLAGEAQGQPEIVALENLSRRAVPDRVVGPGAQLAAAAFSAPPPAIEILPEIGALARFGARVEPEAAAPLYVKSPDAHAQPGFAVSRQ